MSFTVLFDPVHIWLGPELRRQAPLSCVLWPPHNIVVMQLGKDCVLLSVRVEAGEGRRCGWLIRKTRLRLTR